MIWLNTPRYSRTWRIIDPSGLEEARICMSNWSIYALQSKCMSSVMVRQSSFTIGTLMFRFSLLCSLEADDGSRQAGEITLYKARNPVIGQFVWTLLCRWVEGWQPFIQYTRLEPRLSAKLAVTFRHMVILNTEGIFIRGQKVLTFRKAAISGLDLSAVLISCRGPSHSIGVVRLTQSPHKPYST